MVFCSRLIFYATNDDDLSMTKIALIQLKTSIHKNQNLKKILEYIKYAAKNHADVCIFPEFMMFYYDPKYISISNFAESINGSFIKQISYAAKSKSINIIGTFYEKSNTSKVYDTAFFIDKYGTVITTYRKIHLYDAFGFKESDYILPGSKIMNPINTGIGKLGMLICYDLRFPEISRILTVRGSEILVIPSAWINGYMKEQHWLAINKTRAIENGCYVIASNQVGNIYCGRSLVVDPMGKILLDMKKRENIKFVNVCIEKIRHTRKKLPLLKHRRPDVYGEN